MTPIADAAAPDEAWNVELWPVPLPIVAEGVLAQVVEHGGAIWIVHVATFPDVRGKGCCGRYLDSLPRDRRIVVPSVISGRLIGMLERRDFAYVRELALVNVDGGYPEMLDGYVREPA